MGSPWPVGGCDDHNQLPKMVATPLTTPPTTTSQSQNLNLGYNYYNPSDTDYNSNSPYGILYSLLTSDLPTDTGVTSSTTNLSTDKNNNEKRARDSRNNYVSWKEKPCWAIYVADQRDHLPKFDLTNKFKFPINHHLNQLVSLSLDDTCISNFSVDAIVNPTTEYFQCDHGVSKSINEEAGPRLGEKCCSLNMLGVGEAVMTEGFNLPAKYIIHTNGPQGCNSGWEIQLQTCYLKSLHLLIDAGLRTIVFPCISTGKKGTDPYRSSEIALFTVRRFLEGHGEMVDRVIFSLHNTKGILIYRRLMQIFFPFAVLDII